MRHNSWQWMTIGTALIAWAVFGVSACTLESRCKPGDPDCEEPACQPEDCGLIPPGCDPPICADGTRGDCDSQCVRSDEGRCHWIFEYSECPDNTCGGPGGPTCGDDEYCDFTPDTCGLDGEFGVCQPRPGGWDDVYDPVCGCHGETYSNLGGAYDSGVDIISYGPCDDLLEECTSDECGVVPPGCDPPMCADGTHADCDSQCVRNDEGRCHWVFEYGECPESPCGGPDGLLCSDDEYCDFTPDTCGRDEEFGICRPRPEGFDGIYHPVCGCGGKTYSNAGEAQGDGVDVMHTGACEE